MCCEVPLRLCVVNFNFPDLENAIFLVITHPRFSKFEIIIESMHLDDRGDNPAVSKY